MAQLFNELNRQADKNYEYLYDSTASTYDSIIFDPSYHIAITKGNDYFKHKVATYNYSHNDIYADFLNDDIDINTNATSFEGEYTTYAMYINPAGEITIIDWNYYLGHKGTTTTSLLDPLFFQSESNAFKVHFNRLNNSINREHYSDYVATITRGSTSSSTDASTILNNSDPTEITSYEVDTTSGTYFKIKFSNNGAGNANILDYGVVVDGSIYVVGDYGAQIHIYNDTSSGTSVNKCEIIALDEYYNPTGSVLHAYNSNGVVSLDTDISDYTYNISISYGIVKYREAETLEIQHTKGTTISVFYDGFCCESESNITSSTDTSNSAYDVTTLSFSSDDPPMVIKTFVSQTDAAKICGTLELPRSIMMVCDYAFQGMSGLTVLNINDIVTMGGHNTFYGALQKVNAEFHIGTGFQYYGTSTNYALQCLDAFRGTMKNQTTGKVYVDSDNIWFKDCGNQAIVTKKESTYDARFAYNKDTMGNEYNSASTNYYHRTYLANSIMWGTLSALLSPHSDIVYAMGAWTEMTTDATISTIDWSSSNIQYMYRTQFYGCGSHNALTFKLPTGLKYVHQGQFGVTIWPTITLEISSANSDYVVTNNILINKTTGWAELTGRTNSAIPSTYPDTVKYITFACNSEFSSAGNNTLYLPSSLLTIYTYAFYKYKFTTVHCAATTPPSLAGASHFLHDTSEYTLYVPTGCSAAYAASDWSRYFGTILEE